MFVNLVPVVTAKDMYEAVTSISDEQDIIIKAAAVADYRPAKVSDEKVKKSEGQMSIDLERTDDILKYLGEHKPTGQFLCGFSNGNPECDREFQSKAGKEEPGDGLQHNNVKVEGAGFQGAHQCPDIDHPGRGNFTSSCDKRRCGRQTSG